MNLHYETVSIELREILHELMKEELFSNFRLVGGTSLSLQRGHRKSTDIDLFTDEEYGSIDFNEINEYLKNKYPYLDSNDVPVGMGKAYFIGDSKENSIKLDLYYTDKFIDDLVLQDGVRLASTKEIASMKMDIIQRTGRKKDFWDLHDLMELYSLNEMLCFHKERYPYSHDRNLILNNLTEFESADEDFEPICLKGKVWELIKLDFIDVIK